MAEPTARKKLFPPVASLEAAEARAYIAAHPEGTYTILDVRQPGEYEAAHLPGAKLIPLPQLPDDYRRLDPEQPTIVHCASGNRSRVAAQMLSGLGFKEIYNLAGGLKAFQGQKAAGPQELNLDLVRGDETPPEIIRLAYGMEKALQLFYDTMVGKSSDGELQGLFRQLAQVEVSHQQRLAAAYRSLEPGADPAALEAASSTRLLEGGFEMEEFMARNAPYLDTAAQVLELAMMLETQALDLYLRLAGRCAQAATREVLFQLAGEEKAHLARLGQWLEKKLGGPG